MSDDGADLGMTAEAAVKAVLGGGEEPPTRTPEELRAVIEANQGDGYDGCANRAALAVLQLFETVPASRTWSTDDPGDPLYQSVKDGRPDLYDEVWSQMTGFQWGWAVNAAKYIVGEPPVPNPAILVIGGE